MLERVVEIRFARARRMRTAAAWLLARDHAGDWVEVSSVVDDLITSTDHFELDDAAASLARDESEPYRGGAARLALAIVIAKL